MCIAGYVAGYNLAKPVSNPAQKRALQNYRSRLNERGMARFEVLGLGEDRELIRTLARRLADCRLTIRQRLFGRASCPRVAHPDGRVAAST
jgi:hypothetical protein